MYNIAAFIEFDKKITNKILSQKKNIKKKFGNQIYLNHPVHLTLFTLCIKNISELKKIYSNKNIGYSKQISINLFKSGVFLNDPLTNGHTLFYQVRKTSKITRIQLKHLKKINDKIKVFKNKVDRFDIPVLRKNYKKFGFPFFGKIWIPHTTIASIKGIKSDDKFIKKFLSSKINLKYLVNQIKFYKIDKDKHDFLFDVKNF